VGQGMQDAKLRNELVCVWSGHFDFLTIRIYLVGVVGCGHFGDSQAWKGLPPESEAGPTVHCYLNASLTFSPAFFKLDFVWSFLPSPSVSLSPVTLPACSLALPATSCAAFFALSV